MIPNPGGLARLAERQYGVISHEQVIKQGGDDNWIRTQIRAGRWVRRVPRVYLTHTGKPSWNARAYEALLYVGTPTALSHRSAAFRLDMIDRAPSTIEVSVPHERRVTAQPGIVVHRRRHMPHAFGRIPALDAATTFVDIAGSISDVDEIVGLARAALARASLDEIRAEMGRRRRLASRSLLVGLLGAVEAGIESPLEYRYHRDVERRHQLPSASLQQRQVLDGLWIRSDCVYEPYGVRVELDGQLAHPGGRTDADTWRDNAALVIARDLTLRYRWAHVATRPCATARQVAQALRSRGWQGDLVPCGPGCVVAR